MTKFEIKYLFLITISLSANPAFSAAKADLDLVADLSRRFDAAIAADDINQIEDLSQEAQAIGGVDAVQDGLGRTPLVEAVKRGRTAIIERLVAHGADVNQRFGEYQVSLLRLAVIQRQIEAINTLIALGTELDPLDRLGHTPLDIAWGSPAIFEILRAAGAHLSRELPAGS